MLRKRWIVAWRRWWNRFSLWERTRRGLSSMLCVRYSSRDTRPQQEQWKTSQQLALPTLGGFSMKALQRVVWNFIFLVFGVHMVKTEEQEVQVQKRSEKDLIQFTESTFDGRGYTLMRIANGNAMRAFCLKQKEKRNSQGKDPRTFQEHSQGGDLSTPQTNSQGEDPRTLKNQLKGGGFRRSGRKRSGRKRKRKRKRRRRNK